MHKRIKSLLFSLIHYAYDSLLGNKAKHPAVFRSRTMIPQNEITVFRNSVDDRLPVIAHAEIVQCPITR